MTNETLDRPVEDTHGTDDDPLVHRCQVHYGEDPDCDAGIGCRSFCGLDFSGDGCVPEGHDGATCIVCDTMGGA